VLSELYLNIKYLQNIIRVCLSAILCTGYRHVKYLLHVFCGNEVTACLRRNLEQQRNMHRKLLRPLQLTCFDTIQTCYFCKHLYILSQRQMLATSQFKRCKKTNSFSNLSPIFLFRMIIFDTCFVSFKKYICMT